MTDEDTRQRYAEEMRLHWLDDDNTDASGNTLCVCAQWADGEDESWDEHMADVVAAVRDQDMAALRREVEQLRVAASPLKAAAAGRLVASATSVVRIERDDARQRADRAEAANDRIRELHASWTYKEASYCRHCSENAYPDYQVAWPCPTIRALVGPPPGAALDGEETGARGAGGTT